MELVTRNGWDARPPTHNPTRLPWTRIDAIAIHYTAAFSDEIPEYKDRVKGIQNFHMLTNGWNDIAYSYLVARDGTAFVGRGDEVETASTLGHNDHVQAICFLGNDTVGRDDVTDKGRRTISELLFRYEKMSGKKISDVNVKHPLVNNTLAVSGHKVFTSTDCPGAELFNFVATRGWEAYRSTTEPSTYPVHFFDWAAWYLGEGIYKLAGPKNRKFRPKYPLMPVAPIYWLALRRFLKARENH